LQNPSHFFTAVIDLTTEDVDEGVSCRSLANSWEGAVCSTLDLLCIG